jgi:hypothetical protein
MAEPIYLEHGAKRVFACSLAWPGWCRVARDEAAAIDALAAYAQRYAVIAAEAGMHSPPAEAVAPSADMFVVVEHVPGSGATDFGIPDAVPTVDAEPLDAAEAARLADLVAASWRVFDRVAAAAPAGLRKGPRGGGRDRDAVIQHVADAERAYARQVGVRYTPTQLAEPGAQAAMRAELLDLVRDARDGAPVVNKGWPPRYAARRIAWHVLDHLWEIEDKST